MSLKSALKICFISVVCFGFLKKASADQFDDGFPVVNLPKGPIFGRTGLSLPNNKTYYAFQEIPYAAPPVGELRFKEPTEVQAWNKTKNCTAITKRCYQFSQVVLESDLEENEDCLYLNVYTPLLPRSNFTDNELLPVLFWIHGGAFQMGDSSYEEANPRFYLDQNIVVISINYRLGVFGFLTTLDSVFPANLALKDQLLALKWTNENIRQFGGDPSKITMGGQSAGAASVGLHLNSKKSSGLFRAAIMQSGSAVSSWANQYHYRYFAYKMGSQLDPNFSTNNTSKELYELLRKFNASDIQAASLETTIPTGLENSIYGYSFKWAPVIESESYEGAFITESGLETVKNGKASRVPLLMGFNSEEFLTFYGLVYSENYTDFQATEINRNRTLIVNNLFDMTPENKLAASEEISRIYTRNGSFVGNKSAIIRYCSDIMFETGVTLNADLQSAYSDVYLYMFSYRETLAKSMSDYDIEGTDRVGHSEDLLYMLKFLPSVLPSTSDSLTSSRFVKLLSDFVKYLNPTPEKDSLLDNVIWPKVTPENLYYLDFNDTLSIKTSPRQYNDWKRILKKYLFDVDVDNTTTSDSNAMLLNRNRMSVAIYLITYLIIKCFRLL